MDKTKKVLAIIGTIVTLFGAILGGGSATSWTFDFSQDHSTNISDDDTTTINEGDTILGIDKDIIADIGKKIICDVDDTLCD